MALIRYLVFGLLIAFIVTCYLRPDILMPRVEPVIHKAEEVIEERMTKSPEVVESEEDTISHDELTDDTENMTSLDESAAEFAQRLPNTLREAGFVTAFSMKEHLPEFTSVTPDNAGAFANNVDFSGLVGGVKDDIALVPWLVGLRIHTEIIHNGELAIATETCGGGVYNRRWIITAAHCIEGDYNVIEVIAGASDLSSDIAVRRVTQRAFIHAGYERSILREDIGIIELAEPLPDFIPDAPWPTEEQAALIPTIEQVTARGFGLTEDGTADAGLKKVDLAVEDSNLRIIRVSSEEGKVEGLCQGDSGTPIEADSELGNFIVGMVSYTEAVSGAANCSTPGFVAGLVSLEGYMKEIRNMVRLCTEQPEICNG